MCQRLPRFKPQPGNCGYPTLCVTLLISVSLSDTGRVKEFCPAVTFSSRWNPPLTGRENANPHLASTEWNLTVVHRRMYTHAQTPCWSGRGHDKQLGNHRFHLWGMLARDLLEVDSSEMDIDMKWRKKKKTNINACHLCLNCLVSSRHKSTQINCIFQAHCSRTYKWNPGFRRRKG